MAAVIKGCQAFDRDLNIAGVVLNRVAGPRQEALVRESIERYCDISVVGSVPKLKENFFPERHMGLVPCQERDHAEKAISRAKATVKDNLQLNEIWDIAISAESLSRDIPDQSSTSLVVETHSRPRIGVIRDKTFWFYYPENLEQLECMGARLVEIDSMADPGLPHIDALYIGGGFPETQARALSDNESFRTDIREAIEKGLPVYAECGGLMYLGQKLIVDGREYPMVGAIPVECILQKRPQGHGYTVLEVEGPNPYYPPGETLKGHEFHYSMAVMTGEEDVDFVFGVTRGHGVDGRKDGICKKNLLATYTHVHGAGNALWAKGLFRAALDYKK
jgi:cobyrinic acid a,c-diamide synthase